MVEEYNYKLKMFTHISKSRIWVFYATQSVKVVLHKLFGHGFMGWDQ